MDTSFDTSRINEISLRRYEMWELTMTLKKTSHSDSRVFIHTCSQNLLWEICKTAYSVPIIWLQMTVYRGSKLIPRDFSTEMCRWVWSWAFTAAGVWSQKLTRKSFSTFHHSSCFLMFCILFLNSRRNHRGFSCTFCMTQCTFDNRRNNAQQIVMIS